MFNPRIQYHRVNDLVLPQRSFGNSFLNNALKIGGGIMSWRDAKKQQEALQDALNKQEEWRERAYQDWKERNGFIEQNPLVSTYSQEMTGYKPNEALAVEPTPIYDERNVDLDRQKQIAESNDMKAYLDGFDPKKATIDEIKKVQRIVTPEGQDADKFADGKWGNLSQAALDEYRRIWGF